MPDDIYKLFGGLFGLSPLNTILLAIIIYLIRERFGRLQKQLANATQRIERAEKSLLAASIILLDLEDQ